MEDEVNNICNKMMLIKFKMLEDNCQNNYAIQHNIRQLRGSCARDIGDNNVYFNMIEWQTHKDKTKK